MVGPVVVSEVLSGSGVFRADVAVVKMVDNWILGCKANA
jgi:hypothetical protein